MFLESDISRFKFRSVTYCLPKLFNFGILVFSGNWDNNSFCKIVTRFRNNVSETCNIVFDIVFYINSEKTVFTFSLEIFDGRKNICYS